MNKSYWIAAALVYGAGLVKAQTSQAPKPTPAAGQSGPSPSMANGSGVQLSTGTVVEYEPGQRIGVRVSDDDSGHARPRPERSCGRARRGGPAGGRHVDGRQRRRRGGSLRSRRRRGPATRNGPIGLPSYQKMPAPTPVHEERRHPGLLAPPRTEHPHSEGRAADTAYHPRPNTDAASLKRVPPCAPNGTARGSNRLSQQAVRDVQRAPTRSSRGTQIARGEGGIPTNGGPAARNEPS